MKLGIGPLNLNSGEWIIAHIMFLQLWLPAQHQVSQNFSIKRVLVREASSLAEDLMAVDKCWEIERIKLLLEFGYS